MNKTGHGRWGRYKKIDGTTHKLCNGPLHDAEGAFLPLRSFWVHKSGERKGKPMSRCIACQRVQKGRHANSGLVSVDSVYFIFREIEARIGRAEACRRLGVSMNMWMRLDHRVYQRMYKSTVAKAIIVLRELRAENIVRHRDSIKHGSGARGRREKVPTTRRDYYISHGDDDTERRRRWRLSERK